MEDELDAALKEEMKSSQEWKSLSKRSKPLVTPFEGLQEPVKAYNGPIGR